MDADPYLQTYARRDFLAQVLNRADHQQPRAHGALGVILVRLRHAEEAHQAVAQELVDVAAQASNRRGGCLLALFRDSMPLFGIEL